jgi:signal peptidase I
MKKGKKRLRTAPEVSELKAELNRVKYKRRYATVLRSTVYTLVVVAAFAILVATLWMPVLQIYGSSMSPTLDEGQIVVSLKSSKFEPGDLVAFYIGNKLLVKRVIACPADMVVIEDDGTVYINGEELHEPYVNQKALGECDLEFPYQVPESRYFLMGDHRESSVDSRSSSVGCVSEEQIVGKIAFCVWPVQNFGIIE